MEMTDPTIASIVRTLALILTAIITDAADAVRSPNAPSAAIRRNVSVLRSELGGAFGCYTTLFDAEPLSYECDVDELREKVRDLGVPRLTDVFERVACTGRRARADRTAGDAFGDALVAFDAVCEDYLAR
jgi:hypothetical protein